MKRLILTFILLIFVCVSFAQNSRSTTEYFSSASVDMGLSVKWGACNLGAQKSHEVGNYYAWGETEPKSVYSWATYKYSNGSENSLTKYGWNSSMGIVDNIHKLESMDDVCYLKLGSNAHIPTDAEWQELIDNTTQKRMTVEGVDGWLFTSKKNGNTLFFPNGSYNFLSGLNGNYTDQVYCWASTNNNCWGSNGQIMNAAGSTVSVSSITRAAGLNIRPVFTLGSTDENPDATEINCLTVWQKDGAKVVFALSQRPKVTMEGEAVRVESSSASTEFSFGEIRKITYDVDSENDIRTIVDETGKQFTLSDGSISFIPADKDLNVRIIALNGIVVNSFVVRKGNPSTFPLSALAAGVYFVDVNGVTYKIAVR